MPSALAIGDFSRATHLNIKALRHYHRIGLLVPAEVDPFIGHRRYTSDQIPTAQVIRRFRALDMPLEEIHAVITTADPGDRNELIAAHLQRLEMTMARTQKAAASLRDLLQPPVDVLPVDIQRRRALATPAAAVTDVIDVGDANAWYQGALGELHALLAAQKIIPNGPGGAIYANDLFSHERGEATVFLPCDGPVRATGRVTALIVPEVELALTVHLGPHSGDIDLAYGSLATYVTDHALAVEGPIREYYPVGSHETSDEALWRTEIGWPIFDTGHAVHEPPDDTVPHGDPTTIAVPGRFLVPQVLHRRGRHSPTLAASCRAHPAHPDLRRRRRPRRRPAHLATPQCTPSTSSRRGLRSAAPPCRLRRRHDCIGGPADNGHRPHRLRESARGVADVAAHRRGLATSLADLVDALVKGRHVAHTDGSNTKRLLASVWIWTPAASPNRPTPSPTIR